MKVIGIGLNKTGTKTLKNLLESNGYLHQSYDLDAFNHYRAGRIDELLDWVDRYDSFEDWPWPLIYQEIDQRFPDAKFILTVRTSPEIWYQSLCKMAVRMGPLNDYERHIYGYSMPQGRKKQHIEFYQRHVAEVQEYFAGRENKLVKVCIGNQEHEQQLAEFLNIDLPGKPLPKTNESLPVYAGENLFRGQLARIQFQTKWKLKGWYRGLRRRLFSGPK